MRRSVSSRSSNERTGGRLRRTSRSVKSGPGISKAPATRRPGLAVLRHLPASSLSSTPPKVALPLPRRCGCWIPPQPTRSPPDALAAALPSWNQPGMWSTFLQNTSNSGRWGHLTRSVAHRARAARATARDDRAKTRSASTSGRVEQIRTTRSGPHSGLLHQWGRNGLGKQRLLEPGSHATPPGQALLTRNRLSLRYWPITGTVGLSPTSTYRRGGTRGLALVLTAR
jgi:hypothetical protein